MIKSFTHSTTMIRYDIIASNNQPFLSMSTSYSKKTFLCKDSPLKELKELFKKNQNILSFSEAPNISTSFPSKCLLNLLNRFLRKKTLPLCIPSSMCWFLNINILKKVLDYATQHTVP